MEVKVNIQAFVMRIIFGGDCLVSCLLHWLNGERSLVTTYQKTSWAQELAWAAWRESQSILQLLAECTIPDFL